MIVSDEFLKQCETEAFPVCVTEQTHDIRVCGLCDGARFAVPSRQIFPENSGKIR